MGHVLAKVSSKYPNGLTINKIIHKDQILGQSESDSAFQKRHFTEALLIVCKLGVADGARKNPASRFDKTTSVISAPIICPQFPLCH